MPSENLAQVNKLFVEFVLLLAGITLTNNNNLENDEPPAAIVHSNADGIQVIGKMQTLSISGKMQVLLLIVRKSKRMSMPKQLEANERKTFAIFKTECKWKWR